MPEDQVIAVQLDGDSGAQEGSKPFAHPLGDLQHHGVHCPEAEYRFLGEPPTRPSPPKRPSCMADIGPRSLLAGLE